MHASPAAGAAPPPRRASRPVLASHHASHADGQLRPRRASYGRAVERYRAFGRTLVSSASSLPRGPSRLGTASCAAVLSAFAVGSPLRALPTVVHPAGRAGPAGLGGPGGSTVVHQCYTRVSAHENLRLVAENLLGGNIHVNLP